MKVTEGPPGTEAVTPVVGPVGVSVLLASPLALVTDVEVARTPLPDVTVQVTVTCAAGRGTALGIVTCTTRGAGSGLLIVPTWLLPETIEMENATCCATA